MNFAFAQEKIQDEYKSSHFAELYTALPNRDSNPKLWDEQRTFWKNILSDLFLQDSIITFNVENIAANLMWNDTYPPLKPALMSMLKSKEIVPLKKFMQQRKTIFF